MVNYATSVDLATDSFN